MYSREVRLPADLVYSTVETDRPDSGNDFITTRREILREAFQATRETLVQAARHRKRWYDMRCRPQTFATNDSVWCLVPKKVSGRYQKWRSQYDVLSKSYRSPDQSRTLSRKLRVVVRGLST